MLDAENSGWLLPLLHMHEPPEYDDYVEPIRMGRRVWVGANGESVTLPSLLGHAAKVENRPIRVSVTVEGVRTPYRSVGAAAAALDLQGMYVEGFRERLVFRGSATFQSNGREYLFEVRKD